MSERLSPMMEALKQVRNTPSTVRDALAGRDKRLREEMKTKNPSTPARCDELETIGYVHPTFVTELEYGHDEIFRTVRIPESWEPVITRQNAEEIIAAKDERIKELEEHFAEMTRSCLAERGRNKALEADNKRLREALEPFADAAEMSLIGGSSPGNYIDAKFFLEARAALGEGEAMNLERIKKATESIERNQEALNWIRNNHERLVSSRMFTVTLSFETSFAHSGTGVKEAKEAISTTAKHNIEKIIEDTIANCMNTIAVERDAILHEVSSHDL